MATSKTMSTAAKKKYSDAAAELRQIKANIKQADARKVELETLLKSVLPSGAATDLGDETVEIRETRRLDEEKFNAAFKVDDRPELYKVVVDTAAVKEHFSPTELKKYQKVSTSVYVTNNEESTKPKPRKR